MRPCLPRTHFADDVLAYAEFLCQSSIGTRRQTLTCGSARLVHRPDLQYGLIGQFRLVMLLAKTTFARHVKTSLARSVNHVVFVGPNAQMLRIDTRRIVAGVHHTQTVRDASTVRQFPRHAMRRQWSLA